MRPRPQAQKNFNDDNLCPFYSSEQSIVCAKNCAFPRLYNRPNFVNVAIRYCTLLYMCSAQRISLEIDCFDSRLL